MPNFKYRARDLRGRDTVGHVQAADSDELRRILRANDLFLVQSRGESSPKNRNDVTAPGLFDLRPRPQDLIICIRQMSSMLRAGVPIIQVLNTVALQSDKAAIRYAFNDIEKIVTEGQHLSVGMRRYPKLFSPLVVALAEAGETSGTLDHTLDVAAVHLDREDDLRRKVRGATFYPKLVLGAAVGTISVMLLVVVPVFAQVYGDLHARLPGATLLLINASNFFLHYWWLALLLIAGSVLGFHKYRSTDGGRRQLDRLSLQMPILGPLQRKIAIARFVHTLAGALHGAVPILRAMIISGETADNVVLRDAVINATYAVRDGSPMSEELSKTGEFPIMVTRMIATGEASGDIDEMLEEINRFYDRDVQYAVDQITRLIEPAMTVIIGSIVLVVLLALYMPIFKLGEAFQKAR